MAWGKRDPGTQHGSGKKEIESYRKKLASEQDRLVKLWEAYSTQELALKKATDRINELEAQLKNSPGTPQFVNNSDPDELRSVRSALKKEREKNAKLYIIMREMDDELKRSTDTKVKNLEQELKESTLKYERTVAYQEEVTIASDIRMKTMKAQLEYAEQRNEEMLMELEFLKDKYGITNDADPEEVREDGEGETE